MIAALLRPVRWLGGALLDLLLGPEEQFTRLKTDPGPAPEMGKR